MSFLNDYLEENLKDPEFAKEWEDSELEYTLARNIINRRKNLHLTQREVAERMHTKQNVVSRIENGNINVTLKTLKAIAGALQTDVSSLVRNEESGRTSQIDHSNFIRN
ncbi:helix-turn-helix domain-containing protein [Macrococcus carouselicus]|uniref:XRE family transcriptional regulator n=1 Tax=Macrococcus carouselicus TaxID=69969 RepID=A0A9Q8CKM2_9STAP|nr:helix-turn-helix transcriptional regulator [Macrococcus carouselicus]TDL95535.1 XRE family transcriptional regulator [Macrococcus carouselicus]